MRWNARMTAKVEIGISQEALAIAEKNAAENGFSSAGVAHRR